MSLFDGFLMFIDALTSGDRRAVWFVILFVVVLVGWLIVRRCSV